MEKYQSGQILLIVVLIMTVALTVTLSVATRSITNLRSSSEEANSERAFSAAEAGIEKAISSNIGSSGTFLNNTASFTTTVSSLSGQELVLNNSAPVLKDNPVDVWLSAYSYANTSLNYTNPWNGYLTVYWGSSSDICSSDESLNTLAAVEVIIITGTKANPGVSHYIYEPDKCIARDSTNSFTLVPQRPGVVMGQPFLYRATVPVVSGLLARIVPLYAPAVIGVTGCDSNNANCNLLPSQGSLVTSTGTSDTAQRKIVSFRSYPRLPMEVFPFLLFSSK